MDSTHRHRILIQPTEAIIYGLFSTIFLKEHLQTLF